MKLKLFQAAAEELNALGPLDRRLFRFDEYPKLFPKRSGCMVPWALRILAAKNLQFTQAKNGCDLALERLYTLVYECRKVGHSF